MTDVWRRFLVFFPPNNVLENKRGGREEAADGVADDGDTADAEDN